MKATYNNENARRLIPLLESITSELANRLHEVKILQGRLSRLADEPLSDEFMDLKARLAQHRREIRYTLRELESLGCVIDESVPAQILIPGEDGSLEDGYTLDLASSSLRRSSLSISAA